MHRTDGDANYPAGFFSEGDPLIPRQPTQIDETWLNAVQEELVAIVLAAGLTLTKGAIQLGAVVANLNVAQTFTALKTFAAGIVSTGATSTTDHNPGVTGDGGTYNGMAHGHSPGGLFRGTDYGKGVEGYGGLNSGEGGYFARRDGLSGLANPAINTPGSVAIGGDVGAVHAEFVGSAVKAPLNLAQSAAIPTSPVAGDVAALTGALADGRPIYYTGAGNVWLPLGLMRNGSGGSEPTPYSVGELYFNTTISKPTCWDGSNWVALY
jgi:hypothetical protein